MRCGGSRAIATCVCECTSGNWPHHLPGNPIARQSRSPCCSHFQIQIRLKQICPVSVPSPHEQRASAPVRRRVGVGAGGAADIADAAEVQPDGIGVALSLLPAANFLKEPGGHPEEGRASRGSQHGGDERCGIGAQSDGKGGCRVFRFPFKVFCPGIPCFCLGTPKAGTEYLDSDAQYLDFTTQYLDSPSENLWAAPAYLNLGRNTLIPAWKTLMAGKNTLIPHRPVSLAKC